MLTFLLIWTAISILILLVGNEGGVVFGFISFCVSIVAWFIYGLVIGFSALLYGLYILVTTVNTGGGIVIADIILATVLFLLLRKKH